MFTEYYLLHDRSQDGLGVEWEDKAGPRPYLRENIQTNTQHEVVCVERHSPEGGRASLGDLRRGQRRHGIS